MNFSFFKVEVYYKFFEYVQYHQGFIVGGFFWKKSLFYSEKPTISKANDMNTVFVSSASTRFFSQRNEKNILFFSTCVLHRANIKEIFFSLKYSLCATSELW